MKHFLFYLGLAIFLTFLSFGILSLKPPKAHGESLEIKAKTLLKLIREPSEKPKIKEPVVIAPEPIIAPEAPELVVEAPVYVEPVYTPPVRPTGTCADWMAEAGITDWENATWLINKESGCNPNAVNPYSGACGIAQELPCGKSGCGLGNPVCQLRWMQNYVNNRYGGWAGAVAWHHSHNWY